MAKKDVGKGTVLRLRRTEGTTGRRRNVHHGNEVSEEDDPYDEEFKRVPPVHVLRVVPWGVKFYS